VKIFPGHPFPRFLGRQLFERRKQIILRVANLYRRVASKSVKSVNSPAREAPNEIQHAERERDAN